MRTRLDRLLVGLIIAGFLAASAIHGPMQFNPAFQQALYSPPIGGLAIIIALWPPTTLLLWGCQVGASANRKRFIAAVLVGDLFTTLFQGLAVAVGWYKGPAFAAPIPVQAFIYGATLTLTICLVLLLYRWAITHHGRFALGLYLFIIILFVVATIVGDQAMLTSGGFVFANGYTIGSDVLYALVIYGLPLFVYHLSYRLVNFSLV